jgi:hypothetical protein
VLPDIAVFHQLGPKGIEPALHGFDGVNAAAIRFEEMAL